MNIPYKWTRRFIEIARSVAKWSKDPRTRVGAVAVGEANQILAEGYNGLPRGVDDREDRMLSPNKYNWMVHAEANVVAHAARQVLKGSTVYVTHCCCAQCAALLIQAGVTRVVFDFETKTNMPEETFNIAIQMFAEAGVNVVTLKRGVHGEERCVEEVKSVQARDAETGLSERSGERPDGANYP